MFLCKSLAIPDVIVLKVSLPLIHLTSHELKKIRSVLIFMLKTAVTELQQYFLCLETSLEGIFKHPLFGVSLLGGKKVHLT